MSSLRVVTLNTWKGEGAYSSRLAAMAAGVWRRLARTSWHCRRSSRLPAYAWTPAPTSPRRWECRRRYCRFATSFDGYKGPWPTAPRVFALLSRLPPLSQKAIALSSRPDDGERLALAAELDLGGYRVSIVVLHLTHRVSADDLRRRQLAQALAAADERCIDHILFARDGCLRARNWQVAMNIRDSRGMLPSDHCAVVADFIVDTRRLDGGDGNESDI